MGFKENIAALVNNSGLSDDALQDALDLLLQQEIVRKEAQSAGASEKITSDPGDALKKTDSELKKQLISKLKRFLLQRPKTSTSSSSSSSNFFGFSAPTKQVDQPSKADAALIALDAAIQAYEQTPKLKQAFQDRVAERIELSNQFKKNIAPAVTNIDKIIKQSVELFKEATIAQAQLQRYVELILALQLASHKTTLGMYVDKKDEIDAQRANCLSVLRGQLKGADTDTALSALLSQLEKSTESERLPLEKQLLTDFKTKDQEISQANRSWAEKKKITPETWFDWSLLIQKTLQQISAADALWDILFKDINPNVLAEQKSLGNQAQIAERQTIKSRELEAQVQQLRSRAPSIAKSAWTNNYRITGDEVGPLDDLLATAQFSELDEILVAHILSMQLRELSPKRQDPDQEIEDDDDAAQSASVTGTTVTDTADQKPKMTAEQVKALLRRLVNKEITPLAAVLEYRTYPDAQYTLAFSKLMINLAVGLLKLTSSSEPYVSAGAHAQGDAKIFFEAEKWNTLAEALADERSESLLYFDLEFSKQFYQKAEEAEVHYSFANEGEEERKRLKGLLEKRCMGELVNRGRLKLNAIVQANRTTAANEGQGDAATSTQQWDDSLPGKKKGVSLQTPTRNNVYTTSRNGSGFVPKGLNMNGTDN